ncbi:uncharacterized protein LOC6550688 [Drosophila erecta]|uniref:DUF4794 domain-containing protein n=1 Tax=Drosophila erecta TaxID=7220 RepID=B3NTY5_DROER|nr:uncharacterized protein LOC6550688 [Drosophila erecta]EDV45693.1 uncharacterized protein Dere_GG18636 [Drosophila erecta]
MSKLGAILVVGLCLLVAVALAEPRLQQVQGRNQVQGQRAQQHPYLFLSIPKGRANAGAVVQGFEIVEEEDDEGDLQDEDQDQHDDELEDDEELEHQLGLNFARSGLAYRQSHDDDEQDDDQDQDQDQVQNELPKKQMMVNRDQAGAIMVPDGIIEIEGQSVLDEKTGKAALLVPRAALDAIPDGAVVALMERSASTADEVEEERANRVVVRRRKNNGRRNIRRRGINNNIRQRRRRPSPQRRRQVGGNRRRNVRVIRPQGGNRRRGNQRRRGQVVLQG